MSVLLALRKRQGISHRSQLFRQKEPQTYLLAPYSFDRLLDFLERLPLRKLHDPPPFEGVPLR